LGILKNTIFYLRSDGIADQNNKENKKFGTKKLKNMLYLASGKSLPEQLNEINNQFNSHKGEEKQRDDITIVGIKV